MLELLDSNGWAEEDLLQHNAKLTHVEMFLMSFASVTCLRAFSNITTLKILGHGLADLRGIAFCEHLQHLWVVEGALTSVAGLEAMPRLTHLYLYANRLTSLQGMTHLTALRVLWLADNALTSLDGAGALAELRELHAAANAVSAAATHLAPLARLQALNLSRTRVADLGELARLAALPALREVHFADPAWGAAPLSRAAHYRTLALCALPRLQVLDYVGVTADDVARAQDRKSVV